MNDLMLPETQFSQDPSLPSPHTYNTATKNLGSWLHVGVSPLTLSALSLLLMAVEATTGKAPSLGGVVMGKMLRNLGSLLVNK